jgi:hypothetical protein
MTVSGRIVEIIMADTQYLLRPIGLVESPLGGVGRDADLGYQARTFQRSREVIGVPDAVRFYFGN